MRTHHTHRFSAVTAAAVAAVAGLTAAAPADTPPATPAAATHVVRPGGSIQDAVDSAKPGDTVLIRPGTYRESVLVKVPDLTIRGAGRSTVIKPGADDTGNACAAAGNGICVTGTAQRKISGVRISSLTVSGFHKNGVWGYESDRMTVRRVLAEDNGQQGMGQEKSTRGEFTGNFSRNNAESGIFLANTVTEEGGATDTLGTVVSNNLLVGNRIGVTIRRLRNVKVHHNDVTANCGGVFVVGDEGVPRGGAVTVLRNRVIANNKYCPATARLPFIQGAGVVLTGVEDTVVARNVVLYNVGASPMSGGIVLFASMVGTPNTDNSVARNTALGNKPADLADRDPKGSGNSFTANRCRTSEPIGLCGKAGG